MSDWIWLIPVLPFLGAFLNGVVFRNRVSKSGAAWVACGSVGASLLLSLGIIGEFLAGGQKAIEKIVYLWIPAGELLVGDAGHGALAERALIPVIPTEEEFPYTIRIVSEAMASKLGWP